MAGVSLTILFGTVILILCMSCSSSASIFEYSTYDKRRTASAENLELADSLLLLRNLLAENRKSGSTLFAIDSINAKRAPADYQRLGRLDLGFGRSHSGSQIASFTSANQNALSPEGPGKKRR